MHILKSTSTWRRITALILVISSCFFFSEAIAKSRKSTSANNAVVSKVSPPTIPSGITAAPANGTIDTTNQSLTYTDGPLVPNPTGVLGAPNCAAPMSCSDFVLTVNASALASTKNLSWSVGWTPANVDQDIFIEDANHQLVANNNSTVDPSVIILPIPPNGTVYHLVVAASVGTAPLTGSVALTDKFPAAQQGLGAPPRYMNYPAGANQANGDNEPSMGIDWNPNDPTLQVIQGQTRKNTGGVAFFTGDTIQWRNDFDDCSSPAINTWTDTGAPIITGLDPIGFVDHFASPPSIVGVGSPPAHSPGRIFGLDLAAGTSTCAFSDDDGATWTPIVAGNYPAGPDHETLGGGPYHAPVPTPPAPAYPNAIYYCSQNGVQNAECSRSDDGGVTYGPGVPIFDPTVCGGGIHGHVKVSPQGTVYVPNSSCGEGDPVGANGVAVSTTNGVTWTEQNVPGSTGSQDPAIGIGQNNIGKPAGQVPNTIYLGWISGDGHAHVAHSPDEGATWHDDTDISSIVGSENSVFPIVVAGDDNRAAYAFLGTDPSYQPKKVWHLYIATTYDGGHNWILIDATPDDPVQIGNVCLLGIGCSGGRNLLDFNGIDVDSEGRVLVGYTDGCVNCTNTQNITQSTEGHGTIARQSGGRRLFSAFDPVEPAPPAAPQVLSAVRQNSTSVQVSWLEPDNGGSPITGYKIYRSDTSGAETFLAQVNQLPGSSTLKYLDQAAPTTSNWFYRVTAVNAINEGTYCHELNVNGIQPGATACQVPYLQAQGAATATNDPTGQFSIQYVNMGEPFKGCSVKDLTAVMKVNTMDPSNTGTAVVPPVSTYEVYFKIPGAANSTGQAQTLFVEYDNTTLPNGAFLAGWIDPATGSDCSTLYTPGDPSNPVSGTVAADGTITMNINFGNTVTFGTCAATGGTDMTVSPNQWVPGLHITNIQGKTFQRAGGIITGVKVNKAATTGDGTYTTIGNLGCLNVRPTAVLTANPMSTTPGTQVNFSGAASSDANPCTTIASYTLDFGDGTTPVTQASPFFTHTYNSAGEYAARLTVTDTAGQVSDASQIVIEVESSVIQPSGAVSRKVHGSAGTFDMNLPLSGDPAIECRSGGTNNDYQIIIVFPDTLASVASVSTSAGTVSGSGIDPTDHHQFVVNLSGVTSGQYVTVTLTNAQDNASHAGNVAVTMGVLVGDTTGNRVVNSSDITQTQGQSGQAVTQDNYRTDVTVNGSINSSDITLVQAKSGTGLPASP